LWQEVKQEKEYLGTHFPITPGSRVLLTLSRISPEKGQDRLLKALALWERRPDFPKTGVCLLIAGEPAYMMGKRYEKKLKRLASKLRRSRVHFVGYATGARKKAFFELGHLFVFPSRHESYGLTLMEALHEGKPVLAAPSHGAKEVFQPAFGEMIAEGPESTMPERLMRSLSGLLQNASRWNAMGAAGAAWAKTHDFSETASKLAELVASQ
jgi:glycosyltransferase involved in cell wall biosynthesis